MEPFGNNYLRQLSDQGFRSLLTPKESFIFHEGNITFNDEDDFQSITVPERAWAILKEVAGKKIEGNNLNKINSNKDPTYEDNLFKAIDLYNEALRRLDFITDELKRWSQVDEKLNQSLIFEMRDLYSNIALAHHRGYNLREALRYNKMVLCILYRLLMRLIVSILKPMLE
jgi:hypothetical protein